MYFLVTIGLLFNIFNIILLVRLLLLFYLLMSGILLFVLLFYHFLLLLLGIFNLIILWSLSNKFILSCSINILKFKRQAFNLKISMIVTLINQFSLLRLFLDTLINKIILECHSSDPCFPTFQILCNVIFQQNSCRFTFRDLSIQA